MKPVVVHGGGPQIDDALERVGKKSRIRPGHARDRRRDDGDRRMGAGRPGPAGTGDADQPLRRPGGRPDRQGRRPDPRPPHEPGRSRRPRAPARSRPGRRDRVDRPVGGPGAAGRRLHPGHLARSASATTACPTTSTPTSSPGKMAETLWAREAGAADQHARRAGQAKAT